LSQRGRYDFAEGKQNEVKEKEEGRKEGRKKRR
jgi:hypothetical protein